MCEPKAPQQMQGEILLRLGWTTAFGTTGHLKGSGCSLTIHDEAGEEGCGMGFINPQVLAI